MNVFLYLDSTIAVLYDPRSRLSASLRRFEGKKMFRFNKQSSLHFHLEHLEVAQGNKASFNLNQSII